jgi:AraC-like DNA-binding protein
MLYRRQIKKGYATKRYILKRRVLENGIFSIFPHRDYFELSIYQFGYHKCQPGHMFGPAVRNHFLFHYIFSGKGTLMSGDDSGDYAYYNLGALQGFLLWPGQVNTYVADGSAPWEYAWIEFDGMKARELVMQAGLKFTSPVYNAQNAEDREKMKDELVYIVTHAKNSPLELIGHLYLFISALIDSSAKSENKPKSGIGDFYVHEAIAFIEQHYQDDISIEDIAAFCHLNRSYISKIFKTAMGIAPQDFLIGYRIKKSCELLNTSQLPIGDISAMVGYSNPLNFSRAFKRETGLSPRQWKKDRLISNKED